VPVSSEPPQTWTLQAITGSLKQYTFTFTQGNAPYPIAGAMWEYVVRPTPGDTSTPVLSITTAPSANGVLAVTATSSLSQVALTLYPAATVSLAPGTYSHGLWMNPGTAEAFTWFTGSFVLAASPQP
jgi:hypothetical protein